MDFPDSREFFAAMRSMSPRSVILQEFPDNPATGTGNFATPCREKSGAGRD
jgi:hypothetical protein